MKMAIVEYELFSEDGDRVVVSGDTEEPEDIEVELYSPDLLPGLSRVVDRMTVGSTAEIVLEPAEAFGDTFQNWSLRHRRPSFPKRYYLRLGSRLD